ncbi:MAG TPA: beta-galactosidase [Phycisphaerae bacterium]|nr:beta-galactosidase [Phycisphaerae bacterium]
MTRKHAPISPKCPHMLHGGDYNPDQWTPEIWEQDMRLMKLAGCNAMSVGIFSWAQIERREGEFDFGWLDRIMDMLADNGAFAVLATPSGARPAWMSRKYPEVLRVTPERHRNLHGRRHNHCYTSPVYRQKVEIINTRLAERYKDHPALLVWHLSNEYGGECHCDLCQAAFRRWLRGKYDDSLDKLNHAWWTAFWGHTYSDWEQVESPSPRGETCVHGLNLDWKRFVTHQTLDFMRHEIAALRQFTPDVPVTTNFMGTYAGLDYWKLAAELDVVSWDNYPQWHGPGGDVELACRIAFVHDINRSLKGGRPFMLMESVPSATNWAPVGKLKRPGMHLLTSLQAVAHGSDTVQYFQWRKSRGCSEKFHGAVVDHVGHEGTRVFADVAAVGEALAKLDEVVGAAVPAEAAIIYDWENAWAIDDAWGPRREKKDYLPTCIAHYRPFWSRGVAADVINEDCDFAGYKLLIAPMLYMVRPGVAERIGEFVRAGGVFVATYWSGIVNETDLCFLGGFPGPLRPTLGIWSEEIDALYDREVNYVEPVPRNELGLSGTYEARELCDLIHAETADVLAKYTADFYAGRPALTVNRVDKGRAYYMAARCEQRLLDDFYARLIADLSLRPALQTHLPEGVSVTRRTDGRNDFIFLMNFNAAPRTVKLPDAKFTDMLSGNRIAGATELAPYGVMVLRR